MKNYINNISLMGFVAIFGLMVSISSCKKLIEIPPPVNQISSELLFTDSISIMGAVAGVYDDYSVSTSSLTAFNGGIPLTTGMAGDELLTITTGTASDLSFYNNNILPADARCNTMWSNAYNIIYRINACLEGIDGSKGISAGLKQQLLGELKVDRAMCFFYLVNVFGDVPLAVSTEFRTNAQLPRSTVETVYNQVIRDLTDAQKMLTSKYPSAERARPNLHVANALLAKVYLYLGQWKNAENAASSVINSGLYSMTQNIGSEFLYNNNEAIWQLPANGVAKQTAEATVFVPRTTTTVPTYSISNTLLNAFEPGDLRRQQWIGLVTIGTTTYNYPNKYKNRAATAPIEGYMMIRLGELYLIRAEAFARQNNITGAIADLAMVRNPARVGLNAYSGPADQTAVLNAIMHERQVELFCEWGNRWFDLKRTGTINAVLGTAKTNWKPTAALFPVPFTQIQYNPFLVQNPGYN